MDVAGGPDLGDGRQPGRLGAGHRQARRHRGGRWHLSAGDEEAFREPLRGQYESQGNPYYSTARLWDDGIIDPADTRRVLGMALGICAGEELPATSFGVFRM